LTAAEVGALPES